MRKLFFFLLLAVATRPQEGGFTSHVSFPAGPLEITMLNYEQPKGKPYLIVHFEVRNPNNADERCDWMALCALQREDGSKMSSNYDVMVDSGTGMTRATGPFLVHKRRKATASVLFILKAGDLPGYLVLPDGRASTKIEWRGKVR